MKKTVKFFGLAAIASMALVSCQKESLAPASEAKMVEMTVHAGPDGLTKTVLQEDGTVLWGEGEELVVFQTVGETTTYATSSEGVTTDGGETMTFGVAFAENPDASAFTYNAVYPASIYIPDVTPNVPKVNAIRTLFPSIQKPTATSYDAAADLLIAKPLEATEQPSDLLLSFRRVIGIGKMTIKNLASDADVREVVFTAKHAGEAAEAPILAGRTRVNLTEGTVEYGYDSPSSSLTLDYSGQTIAANGMTAYFASLPFELAEGDSFTVAVTTTDGKVFTKEVTLPAGKTLAVKVGRSSTFSVNMTGAEEEELENFEGEYIVIGKTSSDWRYMTSNTGSYSYLPVVQTGVTLAADKLDLTSSATDFPTVTETWTVEKCGDNYAIKSQGGKYVSWTTGNSAALANDPYELKISKLDNGSYEIVSVADNTRKLRFNSSSPRFAFYTSAQADVYMIPFVKSTTPIIEVDKDVFDVPAAGGEFAIYPTVINIEDDIDAATDADWIDISYAGSDEVDFEVAANTGEARTATIVLSYEGAQNVTVTVNQMAASGNDGSTPEKAFTASEAYAFVSNMAAGQTSTEKYYVKGIISSIKYTFSAQYGTATFNFSDDGTTTSTQFIAYSTFYFNNEPWVAGNQQIKLGDEVIVYGQVVNYSGNTPEFASQKSNLYSLNGKTSDEGGDTPGDLTPVPSQTITFADLGYANQATVSSVAGTNCDIVFAKGTGSNDPKYYTTGSAVRAYGGNTITVTAAEGYGLTTIEFTFASGEGSNAITASTGTYTDGKWTGDASEVVFTIGGTSGHRRISAIAIN